ncbi:MAG: Ada metal-binding domain-containing protein [Candidatus Dormibacteria bacterium]
MDEEFERRYQAVLSRDARFDGSFVTAVTSTGVFCRPVCPSRTPRRENVRFYATAQAARSAGFRACKRCVPEPAVAIGGAGGEPALALIADGSADGGVGAVARRLHIGERQLHRRVARAVGVSPLRLAQSRRVQTARALLETTVLPITEVAFSSGFRSVRQFNDTLRSEFHCAPSAIRSAGTAPGPGGWFHVRLRVRPPHDTARLLSFLGTRAIVGIETWDGSIYRRVLRTRGGSAVIELQGGGEAVQLRARVDNVGDLGEVVQRSRHIIDADADPGVIAERLGVDPLLGPSVAAAPGLRLPGAADAFEIMVRAVLGQQVTVAGARTLAGRIVARHGTALAEPHGGITHVFPDAQTLDGAELSGLGLTGRRIDSLHALAAAVTEGKLDVGGPAAVIDAGLQRLPGFGPWTRSYIAMRALGDPDAFPAGDLGLRRALERAGVHASVRALEERSQAWRPWRAYAALHLWNSLTLEANP